jgi:hypothetical protein
MRAVFAGDVFRGVSGIDSGAVAVITTRPSESSRSRGAFSKSTMSAESDGRSRTGSSTRAAAIEPSPTGGASGAEQAATNVRVRSAVSRGRVGIASVDSLGIVRGVSGRDSDDP